MLQRFKHSRYFWIAAAVCAGYLAARVILRVGDRIAEHLSDRFSRDAGSAFIACAGLVLAIGLALYIRRKAIGKRRAYVLWPLSVLLALMSMSELWFVPITYQQPQSGAALESDAAAFWAQPSPEKQQAQNPDEYAKVLAQAAKTGIAPSTAAPNPTPLLAPRAAHIPTRIK